MNQLYQMISETQKYSSKDTSINTKKLPAVFRKLDYAKLGSDFVVLDYGCGKETSHIREFITEKGGVYFGYDKYWKTEQENSIALSCKPDVVVCSNVLNVIAENKIICGIVNKILSYGSKVAITIYEGNRSWIGNPTTKGYQRNQTIDAYLLDSRLQIRHGVITNDKNIIK